MSERIGGRTVTIERLDIDTGTYGSGFIVTPSEHGDYCRYEDVEEAIAAAKAEERERCAAIFADALEFADEGWSYADECFKKKWDYEGQKQMTDEELLKLAKRIATIEYQEAEDVMVYDVPHSLVLDLEPLRAALSAAEERGRKGARSACNVSEYDEIADAMLEYADDVTRVHVEGKGVDVARRNKVVTAFETAVGQALSAARQAGVEEGRAQSLRLAEAVESACADRDDDVSRGLAAAAAGFLAQLNGGSK